MLIYYNDYGLSKTLGFAIDVVTTQESCSPIWTKFRLVVHHISIANINPVLLCLIIFKQGNFIHNFAIFWQECHGAKFTNRETTFRVSLS